MFCPCNSVLSAAYKLGRQTCPYLQVGNYIQHKGGVVTAEELAPYLDASSATKDPDSTHVDESFIVPALVKFGGSPEVDRNNQLIYRFPSLQKTGRRQVNFWLLACSMYLHACTGTGSLPSRPGSWTQCSYSVLPALNTDSSGSCNLCVQGSTGAQAGC